MATWDVIVLGLGGVGSAAAYHLAALGNRVLGLDQYPAMHAMGSSHGKTRIIRQAYFEHPSYVPLLRRAYQLWNELEQNSGRHLFHRTGLVELGPADGVVIPGVLASASQHGLEIEQLSVDEAMRRWPGLAAPQSFGNRANDWRAVVEHDAGYLEVESCVEAHLQCASRESATLKHGRAVHSWRVEGRGVEVVTDEGVERAARLVIAAGPWSARLLGETGTDLRILRKHQYWFTPATSGYGQQDGFPCFFFETATGYYYGFPAIDGQGVKVARHSGGEAIESPTATHPPDSKDCALVQAFLQTHLPGVGDNLRDQAGCYYTMTPDEHFIVDTHPQHEQVIVVAGLSGHGFKFTSVLGELAGDLASGGTTPLDISLLRLGR